MHSVLETIKKHISPAQQCLRFILQAKVLGYATVSLNREDGNVPSAWRQSILKPIFNRKVIFTIADYTVFIKLTSHTFNIRE